MSYVISLCNIATCIDITTEKISFAIDRTNRSINCAKNDLKKLRRAKTIQYDEETEYIDKQWSIHSLIDYTCYGILQTSSIWIPLFMTM